MSTTEYLVNLVLHQNHFLELLRVIQAHNIAKKHTFFCSKVGQTIKINTDCSYLSTQNQCIELNSIPLTIEIPTSLSNQWYQTFGFETTLQLPADRAFERYLLSDHYQSLYSSVNFPLQIKLLEDGSACLGKLFIRARGLDSIKPGFIEVELNPLIHKPFLLESTSWNQWILELAKVTYAFLMYIQDDYTESKILWYKNKPVDLVVQNYDDMPDENTAFAATKALIDTFERN